MAFTYMILHCGAMSNKVIQRILSAFDTPHYSSARPEAIINKAVITITIKAHLIEAVHQGNKVLTLPLESYNSTFHATLLCAYFSDFQMFSIKYE